MRLLLVILAVCAACAGGALGAIFILNPMIESTAPTSPIMVTAAVESTVLTKSIVVRGSLNYSEQTDLAISAIDDAYVTSMTTAANDQVAEGAHVLDVNDRPIIVLQGLVPAYRAMTIGCEGTDVRQLTEALNRLGLLAEPSDTYSQTTAQAVESLYTSIGYTPPAADNQALATLAAARQELHEAQTALEAITSPSQADIWEADLAVLQAQGDLASAKAAVEHAQEVDTSDPATDGTILSLAVEQAELNLRIAQTRASAIRQEPDRTAAAQHLADVQANLSSAEAAVETAALPTELFFVPSLPAIVTSINAQVGAAIANPLLTLGAGAIRADLSLSESQSNLVTVGQTFQFSSESSTAAAIKGVIDTPPSRSMDQNADQPFQASGPIEVIDTAPIGQSLPVTIVIAQSDGDVLSVPAVAVGSDSSEQQFVDVADGQGWRRVAVSVGMIANDRIEITARTADQLRAGDRVIIGRQ
jgi:hypothetical protein